MAKRDKDGGGDPVYTSDLGRSTVTNLVLQALASEGKLKDLAKVRAPGSETVPAPWADEAVIFCCVSRCGPLDSLR